MESTADALAQAKSAVRRVLASWPIYPVAQRLSRRGNPVTILTYHTLGSDADRLDAWTVVRQSAFLEQMDCLRRDHDIVSLDDALRAGGPGTSGRPRAVITFDDGHTGLHDLLLPIVERERLPVTVYVATGHIESRQPYWFDRVMNALQSTTECELCVEGLDTIRIGARSEARNWQAIARVLEGLKAQAPQARERLADKIVDAAAGLVRPAFTPLAPLSLSQLAELSRSRWVTLGAHTHDHALLDQVPLEGALASIRRSVECLARWTGKKVEHFAYPNGNYSQALAREVQAMGFRSAVTTLEGLWMSGQPLHELARVPVGRFDDLAKFRLKLLGR